MITVPKLEMHVIDACNLGCEGCAHYSNHPLPAGRLTLEIGERWLRSWAHRIAPLDFSLLGGEPTLNRELPELVRLVRETWPATRLRLVTNGLLLDRMPELWPALAQTRSLLTVSVHSRDDAYRARLEPMLRLARLRCAEGGIRYEERNSIDGWYRPHRGHGVGMRPYDDGQPHRSWRACASRHCVTLHDGALWKCPPLAHLGKVLRRFGLADEASWRPYLDYRPLLPGATQEELMAFFARGPERACGMCPSRPESFEKRVLPRGAAGPQTLSAH